MVFSYSSMSHINLFLPGAHLTSDFIRRSLMYNLPYSVIAAYLIDFIPKGKKSFLGLFFIALLVTTPIPFLPLLGKGALFKDARVDKIYNLPAEHRDVEYFLAAARTSNDSLIITGKHMIVTNDYFKDNLREAIDIELIHPDREGLFLDNLRCKIKAGKEVLYFDDHVCSSDSPTEFIQQYFEKEYLFTQGKIKVYKLELKGDE